MSTLQVLILYSTTFNDASNSDYGSFVDLIGQETYLSSQENKEFHIFTPFFFSFVSVGQWAVEVENKGILCLHFTVV